ncbi:methyltransferase [Streptomyces sp. NPDC098789]|uniref:methyltransferase n=1 Tax=Streptomyces sp. NPDC098789 TaxID=3366098 RepID=UPI00381B028F
MAASSRMFGPLPDHPVITEAARAPAPGTIVDVAGGNGELLGHLHSAHPALRGTLRERPHAVAAARRSREAMGCADRCDCHSGHFADVPHGDDVYVLSRVLHDWDDERCREILRHRARAMPAHADLLIVERLLPTDGSSSSLTTGWDLHMRCNVGGRERSFDQLEDLARWGPRSAMRAQAVRERPAGWSSALGTVGEPADSPRAGPTGRAGRPWLRRCAGQPRPRARDMP